VAMAATSRTGSERRGMSLLLTQDTTDSERERSGPARVSWANSSQWHECKAETAAPGRHEALLQGNRVASQPGHPRYPSAVGTRDSRDRPPYLWTILRDGSWNWSSRAA